MKVNVPNFGEIEGDSPIVIIGPNGSGKTKLAVRIAERNNVSSISAQRRTWIEDHLPVQEEQQLRSSVQQSIDRWRSQTWQPTEEIDLVMSDLVQDHSTLLTRRNEEAISRRESLEPVTDTKLMRLQSLWSRLFPQRKLEIGGFFPKAKRLDIDGPAYRLREMSDGERTILYMAARVLTADRPIILVDEPELHMHSRLAVRFWNEAEKLRSECRFVYITHDLNFALSRKDASFLIARSSETAEIILEEQLPSSVAAEVLGAATLPFYAKRVFFFEGEPGQSFATEFFLSWFDGDETFAIPAGDRDSVYAAVSGLKAVGVAGAEVIGLVDRDYYSDEVLRGGTDGVTVLPVHEIESVVCDRSVVSAIAEHLGRDPAETWSCFIERVRSQFRGDALSALVARRVRARIGDLLEGAFSGAQINADLGVTGENHRRGLTELDLPARATAMFEDETKRVGSALADGDAQMLAVLPGKHLLSILASVLGFAGPKEVTSLVIRSLNRKHMPTDDPLVPLAQRIEEALRTYLPSRSL